MLNNKNTVFLKQPANSEGQMWQTALPIGDGITGGLIYGAISCETVIINRYDLWESYADLTELPDISYKLAEVRKMMDKKQYRDALGVMQNELKLKGYNPIRPSVLPLGMLKLKALFTMGIFRKYRRGIDMENAVAFVTWKNGDDCFERRTFISRHDGIMYSNIKSTAMHKYELDFHCCEVTSEKYAELMEEQKKVEQTEKKQVKKSYIHYSASLENVEYGAGILVEINDNGSVEEDFEKNTLIVNSADFTVKLLSYTKCGAGVYEKLLQATRFEAAQKLHSKMFSALYNSADISLADKNDSRYEMSNEELLSEAYEDTASAVLYEKLWHFGRYLFISGTSQGVNPFTLYGIWWGDYKRCWNCNVCNENVEMLYWHTLAGNLAYTNEDLVHYYFNKMPYFKENAKKLFGCSGIYVPTYTSPESLSGQNAAPIAPSVPFILHWISGAGWLSLQFYKYYLYTDNEEVFNNEILPFMIETAKFYADYSVIGDDGNIRIYPSISPENTPKNNFYTENGVLHECHIAENATMDIAIMKAVFEKLFEVAELQDIGISSEELSKWKSVVSAIPKYQINDDGAIKEWMSPDFEDNYAHRHFSHIFPLFPGDEIDPAEDSEALRAIKKAIHLRQTDSQSGWSFAHSACMWARLGDGERVAESLDMMCKSCILPNFFTVHNDWRHMGVSMDIDNMVSTVQLDALMGTVNAIQEMIVQYRNGEITILPVMAERFSNVSVKGFKYPEGEISVSLKNGILTLTVKCEKNTQLKINMPQKSFLLDGKKGKAYKFSNV